MRKDAAKKTNTIKKRNLSENQEKQKSDLKTFMIILPLLIVLLTGVCYIAYERNLVLENNIRQIQKDIEAEKSKAEMLNDLIKNRDSDEYVEKIAREQLGYVKPNEIIYIDKNKK